MVAILPKKMNYSAQGLILVLIIVLAAFLRLYRIDEYMIFLGDQGRDALIIQDFLENKHLPFIGPPTSVGNIYLGPFYYYLMGLAMAIFWLNPVAPSVMVAFIGVATVGLIFYLSKLWFNGWVGIIAAAFYAISPVVINYSRFSWNPNPAPFFVTLAIFLLYLALEKKNSLYLPIAGLALGVAAQMHYLTLIMVPVLGFLSLYSQTRNEFKGIKRFWWGNFAALMAFLISLLPWWLFEYKHGFMNMRAIITLLSGSDGAIKTNLFSLPAKFYLILTHELIGRYLTGENQFISALLSLLILVSLIYGLVKTTGKQFFIFMIMTAWLLLGIFGLTFYGNQIFDHYIGFLGPIACICIGSLIFWFRWLNTSLAKISILTLAALYVLLAVLNLQVNPLLYPPNRQLQRTQEVAKFILDKSQDKPYNFALLANNNYDAAYQFFLGRYGIKPKAVPVDKTTQLFVVCEDLPCSPIGNPKYEVAAFGWAKMAEEYKLLGLKIYKLVPY